MATARIVQSRMQDREGRGEGEGEGEGVRLRFTFEFVFVDEPLGGELGLRSFAVCLSDSIY